jgi:FkbM family methyltransferase
MVKGNYDQFFSNYLSKLDLKGKNVYEIGAHIGYHAMQFAQLVGKAGEVHAFEPNIFNRKRFQLNLTKNEDLNKIIRIHDVAVSDKEGEIEFNFSSNVDDGKSSGSFISGAHTPYQGDFYESIGFQKVVVKAISIDNFHTLIGTESAPYLIKIDVEGAENFVLQGAVNVIEKFKPIILIEIHSIFNMYKTCEFFNAKNYKVELLQEESDGRCFIAATSIS